MTVNNFPSTMAVNHSVNNDSQHDSQHIFQSTLTVNNYRQQLQSIHVITVNNYSHQLQ